MALLDLLFGVTKAQIGSITLDASVSEDHGSEADVTEHPVEAGADIADHVRVRSPRLTINGVISNTPISLFNFGATRDRAVDTWQNLKDLQAQAARLDVVTTLETYPDMVIESLSTTRDAARGDSLHFTATLRQITTVESQTVAAPSPKAPPTGLGKKPAPPAPSSVSESVISKLSRWAIGF